MPVVECPHCHTRVFTTNRTCPSCTKSLDDTTGAAPHLTSVTLYDDLRLPPVCVGCGEKTERIEVVGSTFDDSARDALKQSVKIAASVAATVATRRLHDFTDKRDPMRPEARLRAPRCETCARADGPLKPTRVDDAAGKVTLLVHRRFADALNQA